MNSSELEVTIVNRHGLHARPAMQLVEAANRFKSELTVANGDKVMDAKSIMSVMQLAATAGTVLKLTATGEDAEDAVQSLGKLIASGFGED